MAHAEERELVAGLMNELAARREEVYEALVLGTRDYVRKNGFTDVVIGLSGGIDSALVAASVTLPAPISPSARARTCVWATC